MASYVETLKAAANQQKLNGGDSLTLKYLPFILRRVRKKYSMHFSIYKFEDLLEVAIEGSLKAEGRFDKSRGTDFSTYARFDIDGAMELLVANATKSQLALYRQVLLFVEKYVEEHSVYPSDKQIAMGVGITLDRYRELLKEMEPITFVSYTSVDDEGREEERGVDYYTPEDGLISTDIVKLLGTLDSESKTVIQMTCIDELSLLDVMTKFNLTRSQAQSKVNKAKDKFKQVLLANGIGG